MVVMYNQAALLSVQLLVLCKVSAAHHTVVHADKEVSMGGSVNFTCNTSRENTKQINWRKGRFHFSHLMENNSTLSNFTSDRLTIDLSSKLIISNAQEDDEGLYTCKVTERSGLKIYHWNLTVSHKPEEIEPSVYFLYTLTAGIGVVMCCIISAICLYRKSKNWSPDLDLTCSRTLTYVMVQAEFGREVHLNLPQSCVEYKMMDACRDSSVEIQTE